MSCCWQCTSLNLLNNWILLRPLYREDIDICRFFSLLDLWVVIQSLMDHKVTNASMGDLSIILWLLVRILNVVYSPIYDNKIYLLSSFQIYTVNVYTILRFFCDSIMSESVKHNILILQFIYSNYMLSCIILHHACYKCLWEEESRYPKYFWCSLIYPSSKELYSI